MLRREGVSVDEAMMLGLFSAYKKDKFVKAAIPDLLRCISSGKSIDDALEEKQLGKITGAELKKIVQENKGNMAAIMAKYRLRVDSREVGELISKK
jgi:Glu-tRNA(Gln) amidotransferase subunit E-like FAD-binding protein